MTNKNRIMQYLKKCIQLFAEKKSERDIESKIISNSRPWSVVQLRKMFSIQLRMSGIEGVKEQNIGMKECQVR